tara:strand:- start:90 stop:260 length:171 start_codon:yes stop_codon:yes gene_type:complete
MNTIEELQRERNAALANYEAAEEAWKAADRACNIAGSRYTQAIHALVKAKSKEGNS